MGSVAFGNDGVGSALDTHLLAGAGPRSRALGWPVAVCRASQSSRTPPNNSPVLDRTTNQGQTTPRPARERRSQLSYTEGLQILTAVAKAMLTDVCVSWRGG